LFLKHKQQKKSEKKVQNRTVQIRLVHIRWGEKMLKAAGKACTWRWVNELHSATMVLGAARVQELGTLCVLPRLSGTPQVSHGPLIFLPGCKL